MSTVACFGTVDDVESALRKCRSRVEKWDGVRRVTREMKDQVRQLVAGCVNILSASPHDYSSWVTLKPERAKLIRDARAFVTRAGNRAVLAIVDLALSDLEACRPFLDDGVVYCAPLEVSKRVPRQVTEARRAQLARAREAKLDRSRQCRQTVQERVSQRLQLHQPEGLPATA